MSRKYESNGIELPLYTMLLSFIEAKDRCNMCAMPYTRDGDCGYFQWHCLKSKLNPGDQPDNVISKL